MGMKKKMLLGALLLITSTVWAAPTATAAAKGIDQYELKSFIADFNSNPVTKFHHCISPANTPLSSGICATCPHRRQAPTGPTWAALMCWSMMMLRIIKAYDGEIFYHR